MSTPVRPGMTSSQIRAASGGNRSAYKEQREQLEPDKEYSLIRVYKKQDTCVYVFSSSDMQRVELEFTTISDAEKFISELRNEQVPDYSDVYKNMTD